MLNPTALPSLLFTSEDWLARNLPFRGTYDALIVFYLLLGPGGLHALHSVFRSAASPTVPADRDDLAFGAIAPRSTSTLDLPRSFSSSTFEVEAEPFALHVSGAGGSLGFARVGIQSRRPTKASADCRGAGINNFRPRCRCARTSQSDTVAAAEMRFVSPIANQGPDPQAHR